MYTFDLEEDEDDFLVLDLVFSSYLVTLLSCLEREIFVLCLFSSVLLFGEISEWVSSFFDPFVPVCTRVIHGFLSGLWIGNLLGLS